MSRAALVSLPPFGLPARLALMIALLFAIAFPQGACAGDVSEGTVIPRVYDIRDLIESPADPTGDPTMSHALRAELRELGYLRAEEEPAPAPNFGYADVIAGALRAMLGPSATTPRSVEVASGGFLICTADGAEHQQVERFLERLRGSRRTLIHISARLIDVRKSTKLPSGFEEGPFLLGSDRASVQKALESLLSIDGVELLTAPELVVFPLQRANVSVTRQVSYIAGYQSYRNVLPGGVDVAVPLIKTLSDGLVFDCQAIPVGDTAISLAVKVTSSDLVEPVPSEDTPEGPIALPVVNVRTIQSKIVIPPGGAAVLPATGDGDGDGDGRVFVIVQIEKVVPVSGEEGPAGGSDGARRRKAGG